MPIQKIANTEFEYYLILFDHEGRERPEPGGTFLSETVRQRIAEPTVPVTDVFFMSHGWKGDIPAAIEQYDNWVGAMAALQPDREAARQIVSGFVPLIVGLHWPSLPWGDETIPASGPPPLSAGGNLQNQMETQVAVYASRIAQKPEARDAIRSILEAARQQPGATALKPTTRDAYATLFAESGLETGGLTGRPGSDQDTFDPDAIIADALAGLGEAAATGGTPGLLGFGALGDPLLVPLRQLSFWKMKDRARQFGEAGGHDLLMQLQMASTHARFHLMGHSFGCIVVSATVAGALNAPLLPRAVDSLFLVQGALSLWSYADSIPYAPATAGYFHRILERGLVRGPIITTRSVHDTAVGRLYPLGARLKRQFVLDEDYPVYGGIGTFGIRGVATAEDMPLKQATFPYRFLPGRVYNLEASTVIRSGAGLSGAHSDIAHPELTHVFWVAVLAGRSASETGLFPRAGLLSTGPTSEYSSQVRLGASGPPSSLLSTPHQLSPLIPRESRWVNAAFEDHTPGQPLVTGQWYTIAFDVDVVPHGSAAGSVPLTEQGLFSELDEEVVLTVQLDSGDFHIADPTRSLRLCREGKSLTKARFEVSPRHVGASTLKATIHKQGNFIQQMELTFEVGVAPGVPAKVVALGRSPSAATIVQPRDVGISITPTVGGYECTVWGAVAARARLPLQPSYLEFAIHEAQSELLNVVMHQNAAGQCVFQTQIDIPETDSEFALITMARAGRELFRKIFENPGGGADSKVVGSYLRRMVSNRATKLKLQIVAESTPVPWGMLYVGDVSPGARLDWSNFIGMRHVIEQIPLQNIPTVADSAIPSDNPQLAVSVNVNSGIDAQMGADFVAKQRSFWAEAKAARKRVGVIARTTRAEVLQALADVKTDDQILYLFCHAEARGLTDPGGPDESSLGLTDSRITLRDLNRDAPTTTQLRGSPLVFINACESAEMSPAFYDGFVPYFMAKGARGVIGTECKVPALFAAAWAKCFFERFLDGEPLGKAFLELRREFLKCHRNPLGLLYAVHCDGDTQIQPPLTVTSQADGLVQESTGSTSQ